MKGFKRKRGLIQGIVYFCMPIDQRISPLPFFSREVGTRLKGERYINKKEKRKEPQHRGRR